MKRSVTRLWSWLLASAMVVSLFPVGIRAGEEPPAENFSPVQEEQSVQAGQSPAFGQNGEEDLTAVDSVVEIRDADDLAAAIAGQEDGQVWKIREGTYYLTQDHLDQYAHWDEPGQGGWYFPLHADGLTILGEGQVVITSTVESANGAWASQDFISVWGDGITIDGVDIQSKTVPNKAIEIMGKDFTLKNCTILPVVHPDGQQGEVFSGSIYFNPLNERADVGTATLEQVYLHSYISASAAKAGTIQVRRVTMDATNHIWRVWGPGYGPGLIGDVYGTVEDVRYLVDEGAVLSEILDVSSPYAADTKPGTTVVFAPGIYEIQDTLTIGQDVALVGAGWETTIFRAAAEPTVLIQVTGGTVDFSLSGIHIQGVEDNSHNNSSALQIGSNSHPNTGNLVIEGCRFSNFTKNSITVKGGTATITGNIIDCKPYPGAAGNGIQIDLGAEAVITGNAIHGYISLAENWSSCGVLVLRDGKITRIRDNTITACGTGIMKETYYDTEGDHTYLDGEAAKYNTFQNCRTDVDFEFDLEAEIKAYSQGVIRLPCDVTLDGPLTIDKDLAIDGNGFTIYGRKEDPSVRWEVVGGTFRLSNVTLADFGSGADTQWDHAVITVPLGAALNTQVICADVHMKNMNHSAYRFSAGSFTMTGGSIDLSGSGSGGGVGIQAGGGNAPVTGTLSRLSITAADDIRRDTTAMEIGPNGTVEVVDCVVSQVRRGMWVRNDFPDSLGDVIVDISGTELQTLGDAVLLSSWAEAVGGASVRIHSGAFTGRVHIAHGTDRDTITLTGGSFSEDPSAYLAPGYRVTKEEGRYWVRPQVPEETLPGGDSSGGTPDQPTPPSQPQPSEPSTSDGSTTVSTQVTPTLSGDTSKAEVHTEVMDKAVESVLEAAAQENTAPVVEIVVDSGSAKKVEVQLPVASLDTLGRHESASLTITSGVATVTLDSAAITAVADQAGGAQIVLAVAPVGAEELNEKQQAAVGDAPVFDLHLKSSGAAIPHFGEGSATVSIPHRLSTGQRAEGVVVYHLDDEGNTTLRGTSYDLDSETVTFTTPHFSKYMVGHADDPDREYPFADVAETDYFYRAVQWAVEQGITAGTSPQTFSPHLVCTRAQAVMFLWRAAGSPEPEGTANPFVDVWEHDGYYDAVLWAVEQGITAGTAPDTFSPSDPCTRGQIVTFLWRWDGKRSTASAPTFSDVAQDAYYYQAVQWAVERGVTAGTSRHTFSPQALCTRAQIVTFLFRDQQN